MVTCKECVLVNSPKCPYHASPEDNIVGCRKFKRWERENYKLIFQGDFPVRTFNSQYTMRFTIFRWKDKPPKAKFVFIIKGKERSTYYYKNKMPMQLPAKEFINLFEKVIEAVKENCPQVLEEEVKA